MRAFDYSIILAILIEKANTTFGNDASPELGRHRGTLVARVMPLSPRSRLLAADLMSTAVPA
jgi:hypothetical protein